MPRAPTKNRPLILAQTHLHQVLIQEVARQSLPAFHLPIISTTRWTHLTEGDSLENLSKLAYNKIRVISQFVD